MKSIAAIAACLPLLLASACGELTIAEGEGEGEGEGEALPPGTSARSAVPFNVSADADSADIDLAGEGALLLAIDLLDSNEETGNEVLSPVSVLEAFGMLSAGAHGETLVQLESAMHLLGQDRLHDVINAWNVGFAARNLPAQLADPDQGLGAADAVILSIVNQIFQQQEFSVEPAFLDTLSAHYDVGVQQVDFKGNAEGIREDINAWVFDQTRTRIADLLPADSLSTDTRLVLVNALYLKAPWTTPFDAAATADGVFHAAAGNVTASYLHGLQEGSFVALDGLDVVDIPLRGGALSLSLFIERSDSPVELVTAWRALPNLEPATLQLSLPSFELNTATDLKTALASLGVTDLFDSESCDLDGINAEEDLYVSGAFHKAFVALNDKGLEAAAATAIVVSTEASAPAPVTVNVDRPFTFVIRDRQLQVPLFVGRYVSP